MELRHLSSSSTQPAQGPLRLPHPLQRPEPSRRPTLLLSYWELDSDPLINSRTMRVGRIAAATHTQLLSDALPRWRKKLVRRFRRLRERLRGCKSAAAIWSSTLQCRDENEIETKATLIWVVRPAWCAVASKGEKLAGICSVCC